MINSTPLDFLYKDQNDNDIYVKRDDLIPFCFGGNKTRKAVYFFEEIDNGDYDCVVTYGSSSSNHCRVIANMAKARGLDCFIIGPKEKSGETFNKKIITKFSRELIYVPVAEVGRSIEQKMKELREAGHKPYFIEGGGHGLLGTQAYVDCYEEIMNYEKTTGVHFDQIFLASGTGSTQAGLICGKIINGGQENIIGISIARSNPRGRHVVIESVKSYLAANSHSATIEEIEANTIFVDDFINEGYGEYSSTVKDTIKTLFEKNGLPLDPTYTGKAFDGMKQYVNANHIAGNKILFMHTGGTPLFFDFINEKEEKQ